MDSIPDQFDSFSAAIRAALAETDRPTDVRSVAHRALDLLSENLAYEAAITHLAQIARREWNRMVRSDGTAGASDEVVNVRGGDVFLGETSSDDREWLAAHRDRLGDGLKARARAFREYDESAPLSLGSVPTLKEVLAAERRAATMEALAAATRRMTTAGEWGASPARLEIAQRIAEVDKERVRAGQMILLIRSLADRLMAIDFSHPGLGNCRRGVARMARHIGVEVAK